MEIKDKNWFERNSKKTLILLIASFFIVILFITEIFIGYKYKMYYSKINRYVKLKEHQPFFQGYYIPSHIKQAEQKKYLIRIDENGFILPGKIHDVPDKTIFFLGGSTTECFYVPEENRFPFLAGRLLEKESGLKINSFNSAKSGNHSMDSLNILMNKILPLNPNIVIMMHNINDLITLLYLKTYWNNHDTRSVIGTSNISVVQFTKEYLKKNLIPNIWNEVSTRYRKLYPIGEFDKIRGVNLNVDKSYLLKTFKSNLQTFINICWANDITPVLMTQPNNFKEIPDQEVIEETKHLQSNGLSYTEFKEIFDSFNQAILDISKKNKSMVINLAQELPQDKNLFYDSVHMNDKGSQKSASIIAKELKEKLFNRDK